MLNITVTLTADPNLLNLLSLLAKGTPGVEPIRQVKELAPAAAPVVEQPNQAVVEPTDNISIEELRAAVAAKAKAGKRDSIKALLDEFNAESVSTLATANYADFKTKLENL